MTRRRQPADHAVPPGGLPWAVGALLGLVAIVGFGAWFYGYGVLFEPIRQDTGWSDALLSTTYGLSLLGSGILATVVGRQLHRRGTRSVYGAGAVLTVAAYLWGAFASPIFMPLLAWLVLHLGWRPTVQLTGVVVGAVFLVARSRGRPAAASARC